MVDAQTVQSDVQRLRAMQIIPTCAGPLFERPACEMGPHSKSRSFNSKFLCRDIAICPTYPPKARPLCGRRPKAICFHGKLAFGLSLKFRSSSSFAKSTLAKAACMRVFIYCSFRLFYSYSQQRAPNWRRIV